MKLYLKSGQVMKLNEVHTVVINNVSYGIGKYYDSEVDDKYLSPFNIFRLCKDHEGSLVTLYFDMCNCVDTTTDEITAIMFGD